MGDLTRDASAIQKQGGDKVDYKRVTSAGADLGTPDTWHNFPFQAKLKHDDLQPREPEKDRSGEVVSNPLGDRAFSVVITSLQDDTALEQFIQEEVADNFFAIFSNHGVDSTDKTKERFYAIVQMDKSYSSEESGRRPEITIRPIKNDTAITPATKPTWILGATGDFTVAAGKVYDVNASANA